MHAFNEEAYLPRTFEHIGRARLTPPQDLGGEIRCYLRDPDGHLIEVGQTSPSFLEQIG